MGKVILDGYEDIPVSCPFCGDDDGLYPIDTDVSMCANCDNMVFDSQLKKHAEKIGILKKCTIKYKFKHWKKNLLTKIAQQV